VCVPEEFDFLDDLVKGITLLCALKEHLDGDVHVLVEPSVHLGTDGKQGRAVLTLLMHTTFHEHSVWMSS
jgi:hypothetical protein